LSLRAGFAQTLAFQATLSIALLPSTVLAWIEPDPPEEE